MKINLNNKVKVKLTKYGSLVWNKYSKKEDKKENDELELSFWEFMYVFGRYTYIGNSEIVIENNEIEII